MMLSAAITVDEINPLVTIANLYPCKKGEETGFRCIAAPYFLYVHRGKGQYVIGGRRYRARAGDLFYVEPMVPNNIIAHEEDPFVLTGICFYYLNRPGLPPYDARQHIGRDRIPELEASLYEEVVKQEISFTDFIGFPPQMSLSDQPHLHRLVVYMATTYEQRQKHWQPIVNGYFQVFLGELIRLVNQRHIGLRETRCADELMDYLTAHYTEALTNEEVGRRFNYSPRHVSRIVQTCTGLPLRQYLIDLRIRQAITLLSYSRMPVAEVAKHVGFENINYFSRLFRQKTGLTPGQLRRNTRTV